MIKYSVAITVGTYNPIWKKLEATLRSILQQKDVNFQIIISDDGSKYNCFNEVKELFKKYGFSDYIMVAAKRNEGTVSQVYHGLKATNSDYVKPLSPGDLLYDEYTLARWLKFMHETQADITFGDAVFYNLKNKKLNIIPHVHNPMDMTVYQKNASYYDLIINYILFGDGISGASIFARRDMLVRYMKLLLGKVIYAEDFFIRLAILEKKQLFYYPQSVIWYEYADGGISTSGKEKWINLLRKDDLAMDEICLSNWSSEDSTAIHYFNMAVENKRQPNKSFVHKFYGYICNPRVAYWRIHRKLFKTYSPTKVDNQFFKKCFYANN